MKAQFAEGFPHEIGIFLGYPLADVISFMSDVPQKNIACGYWKVYHRPERAERIFAQIRGARNRALLELLAEYYPEEYSSALMN
jgi:hypothetical protein